ncbi:MAG: YbjN domain-containing protein [Myxococcales bacterium]|nr:YbjN domain-containing protein [Myxococcales bacterium]
MFDATTLREHLKRLGWAASPHGETTWRSAHATDEGEVEVYLRLHENWLIASVVPFLATHGDNSFELSRWLLRMNRDMFQTKFAYDDDGDVVLTVELPTESLDFGEFKGALEGLLEATTEYRATLRAAAAPATSEGDA